MNESLADKLRAEFNALPEYREATDTHPCREEWNQELVEDLTHMVDKAVQNLESVEFELAKSEEGKAALRRTMKDVLEWLREKEKAWYDANGGEEKILADHFFLTLGARINTIAGDGEIEL